MIQFCNIFLSFSEGSVFENLSFFIGKGEKVCLSGPSGRGKSTVLKMIQGYVLPEGGTINIDGLDMNADNVKSIRSRLAFVPQNVNLPVQNGRELLVLLGTGNRRNAVAAYLERLDLTSEMLVRPFDEMSGGQKQRIVIAVCLALDRDILLLDEPTASLDDESIKRLMDVVTNLEGKTVVSASHNRQWIRSADRVIPIR
jgi:polar amino acid transport system ATP-binding protein/putative ABC transport system ATP-binding protein